jgi:uncharacterized membrane protein YgcG
MVMLWPDQPDIAAYAQRIGDNWKIGRKASATACCWWS